jgi:hypothetical protein
LTNKEKGVAYKASLEVTEGLILMKRETVRHWLESFARRGQTRDDIHLDHVDRSLKDKSEWLRGAAECFGAARELRSASKWDVSLAIQFYLTSSADRLLVRPTTAKDLSAQLSHTPPALVAYKPSHEPWKLHPDAFVAIDDAFRPPELSSTRVLFQEWFDDEEQDFDHRLWWTE